MRAKNLGECPPRFSYDPSKFAVSDIATIIFGASRRLIIDAAQNVWFLAVFHEQSTRTSILIITRAIIRHWFWLNPAVKFGLTSRL